MKVTYHERILRSLMKGPKTTKQLKRINHRFSAYIFQLRKWGHDIHTEPRLDFNHRYRLIRSRA